MAGEQLSAAPNSVQMIGVVNGSGQAQGVGPANPIPVNSAGPTAGVANGRTGPANLTTGSVATSTSAATAVIARATRRQVTIKNIDTTITVYVGPATVTTANGMELKAGESITLTTTALIQVIAASGTPAIRYADEYD